MAAQNILLEAYRPSYPTPHDLVPRPLLQRSFFKRAVTRDPHLLQFALSHQKVRGCCYERWSVALCPDAGALLQGTVFEVMANQMRQEQDMRVF